MGQDSVVDIDSLRTGRSGARIPVGSSDFVPHNGPDLPCGPPSLLDYGNRGPFPGLTRPGLGVDEIPHTQSRG